MSVKLLTKYFIIIYALRFGKRKVRRLNQSRSRVAPKTKFPAGLGEKKKRLSRSKLKKAFAIDSDAEPVSCA